ncbi:MAG: hypothetical protein ACXVIS_03780 [Halobacteriota archaeon]
MNTTQASLLAVRRKNASCWRFTQQNLTPQCKSRLQLSDDSTAPHFSKLAGLLTRIYQTLHEGVLAFLVIIAPTDAASENAIESLKSPVLT